MRKLAMVLLLISGPACAGWNSVAEDETGTFYADPAAAVKNGNVVRMSSLLDYKDFQRMVEVGYFSQKTEVEYDCAGHRARALNMSLHAEHMGAGKTVYADESSHDWEPISAGTVGENLWNLACRRN